MQRLGGVRPATVGAVLTMFVLAGVAATLGACNTTAGFGEDMSSAGHALTNSADRVKGDNSTPAPAPATQPQ